jgi:flagellar biosynthesis chaperone FliJ
MNSRSGIHRTQQWQLAERQRYLSDLEALSTRLRADVETLRTEIEDAGGDAAAPSNPRLDPYFIRPLLERRDKLLRSIGELDTQLDEARAALASAQQEAKLIEGGLIHRGLKFEDRLTRRTRRMM